MRQAENSDEFIKPAEEILNSDSRASYRGLLKKDIAQMVADGKIGSFLHVLTMREANRLQELAQKSRLKIPLLIGIKCGVNIIFTFFEV